MIVYNRFKFLSFIIIIFFLKYDFSFSSIKNNIIAKVGNEIITSYELENKIKTILFLSKKEINQNNINQVKKKAIQDLMNKKLKKEEIKKFGIEINEDKIEAHIKGFSTKLNLDKKKLIKEMEQSNISYDLFKDDVKIDLSWQTLIFELNKKKLLIDESQIINELNEIISKENFVEDYELAEIVIDRNMEAENQQKILIEIQNYINEFGFKDAAFKYSISSSSIEGGKIGWLNSNSLSDQLQKVLKSMKIGDVSNPINSSDQILFIKLINKRKIKKKLDLEIEEIKKTLINKRKNELLNIFSNNHLSKKRNNTSIKFLNEQ